MNSGPAEGTPSATARLSWANGTIRILVHTLMDLLWEGFGPGEASPQLERYSQMAVEPGPGDRVEDSWGLGGDSLTAKTGLELGGFEIKATSSSKKQPRNGHHFG